MRIRRSRALLIAALAAGALALGLWALPEVVRRVVVAKIPEITGRAVGIEDIDLNLFTGRFALVGFRLTELDGQATFVAFDRLEGRIAYLPLLAAHLRLTELRLVAPTARVLRTGPTEFNFSDLVPAPDPSAKPSRWTMSLDRVALERGGVIAIDRAVEPAQEWRIAELRVEASSLTTRKDSRAGRLTLQAQVNEALVEIAGESLGLGPGTANVRASLSGFRLPSLAAYLAAAGIVARPETGTLSVTVSAALTAEAGALRRATASGDIRVEELAVRRVDETARSTSLARLTVGLRGLDLAMGPEKLESLSLAGQIGLESLALRRRNQTTPVLSFARLDAGVGRADLLRRDITLDSLELDGLETEFSRHRPGELLEVITGLIEAIRPARPSVIGEITTAPSGSGEGTGPAPVARPQDPDAIAIGLRPPPVTLRFGRLVFSRGTVTIDDEVVSPAQRWRLEALSIEGNGLSTALDAEPGSLKIRGELVALTGGGGRTALAVEADRLRLFPLLAQLRVSLEGFDVAAARAYLPADLPASPAQGTVKASMEVALEGMEGLLRLARVSGRASLQGLALVQRGRAAPFLALPRLETTLTSLDAISRQAVIGSVNLHGLDLRAVRGAGGAIDILGLVHAGAEGAGQGPSVTPAATEDTRGARGPSPARGQLSRPWRIALDRLTLSGGTATFEDQAIAPSVTLALTDLSASVERVSWPPTPTPAAFSVSATMPGGGRTEIKGKAVLDPLDAQIAISTRDAPIEPYGAYFPFRARFAGLFSGDSLNEIKKENGVFRAASRGSAWARDLEVRDPDADAPPGRMARMEIRGIDFSWPNYALVERVTLTRPEFQIVRGQDGMLNVRRLFEPSKRKAVSESAGRDETDHAPAAGRADEEPKPNLLQTMVIDFKEIAIEEGSMRFLDRVTTPHFSHDVSKLALTVRDFSNVLGRNQTTMTLQAVVGQDAALDVRGELSGIGESLRADLVGELRDYTLPSANPYSDHFTSWIIRRGKLAAKIHYRLEGDRLTAEHDINFGGLRVERSRESDEARRRLGVPLGLAVALLKDSRGNIDFKIPLNGTVSDRKFDWGEAMWAAVKQVLVKVLLSPFNAIGRMLGPGDEADTLRVDPVTFAAGSSVIAPSMETHITRVADFLRRSPYIGMGLTPVATAADVDSLRLQALRARVREFQEQRKIPEWEAAVATYYAEQKLPGEPPKTAEERLLRLVEREPIPEGALVELLARRADATRGVLIKTEGIQPERLKVTEARRELEARNEGRVEFALEEVGEN